MHWKGERKKAALVSVLAVLYEIAGARHLKLLAAAVNKAAAAFYRLAAWLGLTYHTKKYEWKVSAA
jgi:hypothetical protein